MKKFVVLYNNLSRVKSRIEFVFDFTWIVTMQKITNVHLLCKAIQAVTSIRFRMCIALIDITVCMDCPRY